MSPAFRIVGVVGAGTMGLGVAQSAAEAGLSVALVDHDPDVLACAHGQIRNNLRLKRLLKPDASRPDVDEVLARIACTDDLGRLASADLVVENIVEDWQAKRPVYEALDAICGGDCIFAANTSAIPITRIGSATGRPDKVIGMHFMNPVPLKDAVEVVRGFHTSDETLSGATAFLARMGMRAIVVNDSPGFVSNRVLMLTINEAVNLVHEGVASAETVDDIFVSCFGHKMGPLATADLIGLDTILNSLIVLRDNFGGAKFQPSILLARMVDAGLHGRKSGEGFFRYEVRAGPGPSAKTEGSKGSRP